MGHDDGADSDLDIIANFDAFGVIVFQVRTFAYVDIFTDSDASQSMQSHAQSGAGQGAGQ